MRAEKPADKHEDAADKPAAVVMGLRANLKADVGRAPLKAKLSSGAIDKQVAHEAAHVPQQRK